MTVRCFIGWHRFRFEDVSFDFGDEHIIESYARCEREGCSRYPSWQLVNLERLPRARPRGSSSGAAVVPREILGQREDGPPMESAAPGTTFPAAHSTDPSHQRGEAQGRKVI